jgi:hypothetical protein
MAPKVPAKKPGEALKSHNRHDHALRTFSKKAGAAAKEAAPPPKFYATSWTVAQMDAFARHYMWPHFKAYEELPNKVEKIRDIEQELNTSDVYKKFSTQRALDEAVKTLAEQQKEIMNQLYWRHEAVNAFPCYLETNPHSIDKPGLWDRNVTLDDLRSMAATFQHTSGSQGAEEAVDKRDTRGSELCDEHEEVLQTQQAGLTDHLPSADMGASTGVDQATKVGKDPGLNNQVRNQG